MPEIKTCEQYVLAQLSEKEEEVASIKQERDEQSKKVALQDAVIKELNEKVDAARSLLIALGLVMREPTYSNSFVGKLVIEAQETIYPDNKRYMEIVDMVSKVFGDIEQFKKA